jgi:signal transduction histidine kinase/integral membrane sensor domain MASE1
VRRLALFAAVALAYFIAGRIGLSLALVNESATAVWPPAGIAVGALIVLGLGMWPAVAAGAYAVNLATSESVLVALGIAAGNTLEAMAAAWLVQRFAGGRAAFERTPDAVRFAALAAFAATTIAATIGTLVLLAAGLGAPADGGSIWLTWWLGDAAGVLIVAPVIVTWRFRREVWNAARSAEALALAAAVVTIALVVFGESPVGTRHLPLQFVTVPLLLWSAFRFGSFATAAAGATLSLIAIVGTLEGVGPFVGRSPNESLLFAQGFLGIIGIVMLCVAAEVAARRRVDAELRALNEALEGRVAARTEELTRVHNRLLEAQRVAHIGSWEWDLTTDTIWWSDELYRIYGLDPASPFSYETYLQRIHPDDRAMVQAEVQRAGVTGEPFGFDHRVVTPDGITRVIHGQGRSEIGPEGRVTRMMGTGLDITERVAAEEQRSQLKLVEAARLDAEAASLAKDQFLAMLSHELRTPLNVALGWTHMLRPAILDRHSARAVETIGRNLALLSRLVADIVDVSRMAAGALALKISDVEIPTVVQDAVEGIRGPATVRGIGVLIDLDPSLPPIRGDAARLQQVVGNLLSNAVKFVPAGGHIRLAARLDAGGIEIVVEDNGPGIASDFLPHVFEQFRQGDSSTTREYGGLGLGLSIAKHLVDLHGGRITAGNRATGGAIFTVRLPADGSALAVTT